MIAAEGTMVYTVEETSRGIMDIMLINKMPMSGRTAERKSGKPATWKMAILLEYECEYLKQIILEINIL